MGNSVRPADALGEALHHLELVGTLYCQAELSAPWGIAIPELPGQLVLAVVSRGHVELALGNEIRHLREGTATLLTRGRAHIARSSSEAHATPLDELPVQNISEHYERLRIDGGGATSVVTCAVLRFDEVSGERLLSVLPEVLEAAQWDADSQASVRDVLRIVMREAANVRAGGDTVLTRLSDVLVIQMIRAWMQSTEAAQTGWLAALQDPQLGRALAAMHRAPENAWTVASLAGVAGMSRSAFAARFTAMVGTPVLAYLTEWRLQTARRRLHRAKASIVGIAEEVGYQSEASFGRAFKKRFGISPGRCRASSQMPSR